MTQPIGSRRKIEPPKLQGALLRLGRESKGLTVQEVGDKVGWSRAHVSAIERGQVLEPSHNLMMELMELYDIRLEAMRKAAKFDQEGQDLDLWEMARDTLDDDVKQQIICYALINEGDANLAGSGRDEERPSVFSSLWNVPSA